MAQLPNFLLAAPVLALIGLSYQYASGNIPEIATAVLKPWQQQRSTPSVVHSSSLEKILHYTHTPTVLPHVLYLWLNGLLLLFTSHVQIALRFASPGGMPALWWTAAALVCSSPSDKGGEQTSKKLAKGSTLLIGYLVLWNFASLVLYAGFYPPA